MTIQSGAPISSSYYNSIQTTVANLLGPGGYQQTVTSQPESSGKPTNALDWTKLQSDINKCQLHQVGANFSTASLPNIVSGTPINAANLNLYETQANLITTNKFIAAIGNMTLTSSALTITRSTIWGSGSASITGAFQADWGTVAAMTAFFNTGGEIRWSLAHPSTATPQDTSWNTVLSSLGVFDIHGGAALTSTATVVKFPFNSLTATYQTIFSKVNTTTSYTANTITIQARINASGTGVNIQVILLDGHTNAFYDKVALGTNITCSHLKSTVVMTGISSPTYSVLAAF